MKYLVWISRDCKGLDEVVTALKAAGHEVGMLLAQDGVYSIDTGCSASKGIEDLGVPVFALKHHIEERGIGNRLAVDAKLIEYDDAIDIIMEKYDKIVSM